MKKRNKILKLVLFVAISSFILSMLMHNGYWNRLMTGIKSIKWYYHILLVFFNFFLIILIHELGHLFSFVFSKIKIKALFVLIFILRKDKRWHFEIKLKNIKLIGGLVVPILPEITNDEEYLDVKNKFSKALIMGPITSVVYFVLITLTFILVWFLTKNYYLIGILFTTFVVSLPMTLLIHISSKLNTNNLYGDYVAYDKFKEDKFSLLQIIQYAGFNNEEKKQEELYILNKLDDFVSNNKLGYGLFDLGIAMYYLMYYLGSKDFEARAVNKVLNYYNITSLASSKNGLELAYLIAAVNYKLGNLEQAFLDFNKIKTINNRYIEEDKQELLKLQYENMLNINDNSEAILKSRDVLMKDFDILASIFNIDEELKQMTKRLDFKVYETVILCKLPKEE